MKLIGDNIMQNTDNEQFKLLKEIIKADIEKYPGYIITDDGDVMYNHDPANENPTMQQVDLLYNQIKDCDKYAKAVTNLNYIYSNILTNNTMQGYMDNYADFPFNIMLPMIDTYFVYQNLKDNEIILSKKKKTKLKCDKINPISDYTKKASIVELAIKNYNKLDDVTKKEIVSLVYNTIKDADTIDNIDVHNMEYLLKVARLNNVDIETAKKIIETDKNIVNTDKYMH